MLMSAKLPLPGQVFGHGWVFFKGERMSKSLGNIVDPLEAAERFGADPLRLYLTKECPTAATATSPGSASRRSTTPTSPTTSATS